jgi:hypothetical protein
MLALQSIVVVRGQSLWRVVSLYACQPARVRAVYACQRECVPAYVRASVSAYQRVCLQLQSVRRACNWRVQLSARLQRECVCECERSSAQTCQRMWRVDVFLPTCVLVRGMEVRVCGSTCAFQCACQRICVSANAHASASECAPAVHVRASACVCQRLCVPVCKCFNRWKLSTLNP